MSFYVTKYSGLTTSQVDSLLKEYGKNTLPEKPKPSNISIIISQLKSPLVYVLLVACGITSFLGEWSDSFVILLAVLLNTVLGFIQEKRANDALSALKALVQSFAVVIRNGAEFKVQTQDLVPGDLVVLNAGDKVPADGSLVEVNRLFLSEAVLTGESVPVAKTQSDKAFMGTVVLSGQALLEISHTGAHTEIGKIASQIQDKKEPTPLAKQLEVFSKKLSILVIFLTALVFGLGLYFGYHPTEMLKTAVALAVSAIPEGLLVSLTVVLALGMQRILGKKGLVRNLSSAETLGGVTTICTDKTGTLTYGKMSVVDVVGDNTLLSIQVNVANDMVDPLELAAHSWSLPLISNPENILSQYERIDSIPFSSDTKYFAVLAKYDHMQNILFMNGAPDVLLEKTTLSADQIKEIKSQIKEYTHKGMRIIGYVQKSMPKSTTNIDSTHLADDFKWIGFLVFSDPVRPDVARSLKKTMQAGIGLVVITGDYPETTAAIMSQLGIGVSRSNLGSDLAKMSIEDLCALLKTPGVKLFARTSPSQKLDIVHALKLNGEIVAMLGDGVNDAPALSKADIGVVVNESTDVAKESADLVLLNSSFTTVVDAVEEGRGLFENIRKVILYLMSGAFQEITAILLAIVTGYPAPATATQLLWINLVSDSFPSLALTIDTKSRNIMFQPPRSPKEPLVAGWMKLLISIVSISSGIFAYLIFVVVYKDTGDLVLSRSVAFVTMGMNSLLYVFSIRKLRDTFFGTSLFDNKYLVWSVLIGIFVQLLPFATPAMRTVFSVVWPTVYWFYIIFSCILTLVVIEISKWISRRYLA